MRHIEIDDQLDIVDVDATRHNVRSYQHVDLLGFELIHHFVTLLLFQIRVHGTDLKSGTSQGNGHVFHFQFGRRKDNHAMWRPLGKQLFD